MGETKRERRTRRAFMVLGWVKDIVLAIVGGRRK